jgi:hypothetical protein
MRIVLATLVLSCVASCGACAPKSAVSGTSRAAPGPASQVASRERQASQRRAEAVCRNPVDLYEGSIAVDASDYVHMAKRGGKYVKEAIPGLDRDVSSVPDLRFTLDYPLEQPFTGTVTAPVTLRRIIDAVRAGFRTMYQGTTEREIPGLANKDVRGVYGKAFHVIGDLVIEGIQLCDGKTLDIEIGS